MSKPIVLLTRKENHLEELQNQFPRIEWLEFPMIFFKKQTIGQEQIDRIEENVDWLIFTSQNAVKSFFEQIDLKNTKSIACVGPKTRAVVESYGYAVDFIPSKFTSQVLARDIPISPGEHTCYIGGNLSNVETIEMLINKSKGFTKIEAYHTKPHIQNIKAWKKILSPMPNLISFCSPSAVRSFKEQIEKYTLNIPKEVLFASIGTTTQAAVQEYLSAPSIIGAKYTFDAMIDKIIESV